MNGTTSSRVCVAALAVPLLVGAMAPTALADTGDVSVVNTETVQAILKPSGEVREARVYEQLSLTGHGSVDIVNPVSTEGLRNLDAFGGFSTEDGSMVTTLDVDGREKLRTVSDFSEKLPLSVDVKYTLDGTAVEPEDVVGANGTLEARYTVTNETGTEVDVTYDDGTGGQITSTETVVIPMVGSTTVTLPSSFTKVDAPSANVAGDGRGGTKLTFTMTMFPPIGSPTVEFGYAAEIRDGIVPGAVVSALPVSPLDSPSFKGGAASYKGGAETGVELTAGATEIDANLLKLRDGASGLLAGLIQLREGADKLRGGLADKAAPGAKELAAGASELDDGAEKLVAGATRLDAGASELDAGAEKLAAGAGKLASGAGELAAGASQVDIGAQELAGGASRLASGTTEVRGGADRLALGAGQLHHGIATAGAKAPALLNGLEQVDAGLAQLDQGLVAMYGSIDQLPAAAKPLHDGIGQLRAGIGSSTTDATLLYAVDQLRQQLGTAAEATGAMKSGVKDSHARLGCAVMALNDAVDGAGLLLPGAHPCYPAGRPPMAPMDQFNATVVAEVAQQLSDSRGDLYNSEDESDTKTLYGGLNVLGTRLGDGAVPALIQVECGLDSTSLPLCDSKRPGLLQGLAAVDAGVTQLTTQTRDAVQAGVGDSDDGAEDETLRGGVHALQGGIDQVAAGGLTLLAGLGQLEDGSAAVAAGNGELASVLAQIEDGAGRVADGNGRIADGTSSVAAGNRQLADKSGELAAGNGKLAVGTGKAAAGAGQLLDGSGKLSDGTGQLAEGADTLADGLVDAADGSEQLAEGLDKAADGAPQLVDGAQRLSDEGTKALIAAGEATAQDYGLKYAVIEVGAERAQTSGMAFGAPDGAEGFTAYSLELVELDGEGGRNTSRALGGLVVLGLGAGVAAGIRRRVF